MDRTRETVNTAADALSRLVVHLPESGAVDKSIHANRDPEWIETRSKLRELRERLATYFGEDD